jgi:hypothetical protein
MRVVVLQIQAGAGYDSYAGIYKDSYYGPWGLLIITLLRESGTGGCESGECARL